MRTAQQLQAEFRGRCPEELRGLVTEILDALEWHEAEFRRYQKRAFKSEDMLQRINEVMEEF